MHQQLLLLLGGIVLCPTAANTTTTAAATVIHRSSIVHKLWFLQWNVQWFRFDGNRTFPGRLKRDKGGGKLLIS